jgi:Zn-dependent peptidase ImmA (M78 family)/DNA-binding XRE family transcriptional regulator
MAKALINGKMITWGRNRSDVTPDALAKKLDDIPTERLLQWEQGEDKPTLAQAQKIANTLHIPLGYLYLDTPPQELTETPDLRTVRNESRADYSPAFIETYQSVLLRQQWFREFRLQEGYPELPFVHLFNPQSRVEDVVLSMTTLLEVESLRQQAGSKAKFANLLIEKAESLGILVFRNGVVGRDNRRSLSVEEFRGFAIYDTYAPAIFVNTKDAKSAQVFSILHELAHIWIGEGGISNYDLVAPSGKVQAIETRCDRIAAEVLVPVAVLRSLWDNNISVTDNVQKLSSHCKVSQLVIAIRARDQQLVTADEFRQLYAAEMKRDKQQRDKNKQSSGGPPSNVMLSQQNGKLFSRALLSQLYEGKVLFRDAARLLGIKKLDSINTYYQYLTEQGNKAA